MEYILFFIILGAMVGFFAGLLGIGGGAIMFPAYMYIFSQMNFPIDKVVYLSLGTSMASIFATTLISAYVHNKKHAIVKSAAKKMISGIVIGTYLGTVAMPHIPYFVVAITFSIYTLMISYQMFTERKIIKFKRKRNDYVIVAFFIGFFSSLVSIGGGTLTVPYLVNKELNVKKAIGTSSLLGFIISLIGTLGYIINGTDSNLKIIDTQIVGFVFFPAFVIISLMSLMTVPMGVNLVHKLPVRTIKKIFGVLLFIVSLKVFFQVL